MKLERQWSSRYLVMLNGALLLPFTHHTQSGHYEIIDDRTLKFRIKIKPGHRITVIEPLFSPLGCGFHAQEFSCEDAFGSESSPRIRLDPPQAEASDD